MNQKKYTKERLTALGAFIYIHIIVIGAAALNYHFKPEDEKKEIRKAHKEMIDREILRVREMQFEYEKEKERLKQFENGPLQSGSKSASKKRTDNLSREKVKEVGYGITDGEIALAKRFGLLPKSAKLPSSLTKAQADRWFEEITIPAYTMCVEKMIGNRSVTPEQKFALVSFTHNLGSGCLKKLLCHADEDIAPTMVRYIYAGGEVRKGLVKRRAWEASLWESGLERSAVIASR